MKLKEILCDIDVADIRGDTDIEIGGIEWNFRRVQPNDLFIDSGTAISEVTRRAIMRGAAAVITDRTFAILPDAGVTWVRVRRTDDLQKQLCKKFYAGVTNQMTVIGVTGTKGKTTTTSMICAILRKAGYSVGMVTTIETDTGKSHYSRDELKPHIYRRYSEMAAVGVRFLIQEVPSLAISRGGVDDLRFDTCVYTNLSADHFGAYGGTQRDDWEFHNRTFDDYAECKARLFRLCDRAVVNGDDKRIYTDVKKYAEKIETFGLLDSCGIYAKNVHQTNDFGVCFQTCGAVEMEVKIPYSGTFSVYNALAAISVCRHFGVKNDTIRDALSDFHLKGRMEEVPFTEGIHVFIDYAHNGASMESALRMLKWYQPKRLICLIGLGGDRPIIRRTEVGQVSGELADLTVLTSSNPRSEDPLNIIGDIERAISGTCGKYIVIPDRTEAIEYVLANAKYGDIILLAGKGHEQYQKIGNERIRISDRAVVENYIRKISEKPNPKY